MNTFIMDNDPKICAKHLDYKRLGKQRLECMQIINCIDKWKNENITTARSHHPCVKMWMDYTSELKFYTNCMIDEWIDRGYNNTMEKYSDTIEEQPWWFYNKHLQNSHKAALLRKLPEYYDKLYNKEELSDYMDYTYIWTNKLNEEILTKMKNNDSSLKISDLTVSLEDLLKKTIKRNKNA